MGASGVPWFSVKYVYVDYLIAGLSAGRDSNDGCGGKQRAVGAWLSRLIDTSNRVSYRTFNNSVYGKPAFAIFLSDTGSAALRIDGIRSNQ